MYVCMCVWIYVCNLVCMYIHRYILIQMLERCSHNQSPTHTYVCIRSRRPVVQNTRGSATGIDRNSRRITN